MKNICSRASRALAFAAALFVSPVMADEAKKGDFDGDGATTFLDVCQLEHYVLGVLQGIPAPEGADLNGDGAVDVADVVWFAMYLLPKDQGDLNGDGAVDGADASLWIKIWQSKCPYYAGADLNGDFEVNVADLQLLIKMILAKASR